MSNEAEHKMEAPKLSPAALEFMEWFEGAQNNFAIVMKSQAEVIAFRAWEAGKRSGRGPTAPKHEKHPPMDHFLKCHPAPFALVRDNKKLFEYRKFDRPFQIGDRLILQEWSPEFGAYTDGKEVRPVRGLLTNEFGIPADYCILFWGPEDTAKPPEAL